MAQSNEAQILAFDSTRAGGQEHADLHEHLRMVEAIVFASSEPVSQKGLAERLPEGVELEPLMRELQQAYSGRGVNLVKVGDNWAFRTADDLGFLLQKETTETRKLSRAALEVLAIIAYHQPVTRAEIEEIRGVATWKNSKAQACCVHKFQQISSCQNLMMVMNLLMMKIHCWRMI